MIKIGFKNFRRFENFPVLELGEITLLVGTNNAGKSTLEKGLILAVDNFLSMNTGGRNSASKEVSAQDDGKSVVQRDIIGYTKTPFSFEVLNRHRMKPMLFKTALYDKALKDIITFKMSFDSIDVSMSIEKDEEIEVGGQWTRIEISNRDFGLFLDINKRDDYIKLRKKAADDEDEEIASMSYGEFIDRQDVNLLTNLPKMVLDLAGTHPKDEPAEQLKLNEIFWKHGTEIEQTHKDLVNLFQKIKFEYIPLYTYSKTMYDKEGDTMGEMLSEFYESGLPVEFPCEKAEGEKLSDKDIKILAFMQKWMKQFCIGDGYSLNGSDDDLGGKIYCSILKGHCKAPMAELGSGSCHVMILLLQIALYAKKYDKESDDVYVAIEEPEQNLHPKYQSQLADMFKDANERFGMKFIIETHSEYLIRKTQVNVCDAKYDNISQLKEKNPYKVYYFPETGVPYEMEYKVSGHFIQKFGEGFFDEAANMYLYLN